MVRPKVLIAEDDEVIARLMKPMVTTVGYEPTCGATEDEIITAWEVDGDKICLFIVDASFGGNPDGGVILAKRLKSQKPSLRFLVISGCPVHDFAEHGLVEGFNFLKKPFTAAQLWELTVKLCPKH